jgi:RNA polymerase sigma-70 factor (ECF subfamily)
MDMPSPCPNLTLALVPIIYSELRDDDLIVACQRGNKLAFTVLYRRYKRYVASALYKLSPEWPGGHDDMVQDVFLRIWGSVSNLKNPLAFKTWLNRLVLHLFYDALRKRAKLATISLDEPINDEDGEACVSREIADTRNLPDDDFARNELMQQIDVAISLLPKQFAQAVVLREYDGLEYDEIARLTNSRLGTVKSRIARGRTKIQSRLKSMIA